MIQYCEREEVSGWPKICQLAHAFMWEYSYKRLKLAQLLGQLGVFLTCTTSSSSASSSAISAAQPLLPDEGALGCTKTITASSFEDESDIAAPSSTAAPYAGGGGGAAGASASRPAAG